VVNISTRRGATALPEFTYTVEGGNFSTLRQSAALGGVFRRFDYFSEFSRSDTQNSLPNSSFHNGTYAGNFGWAPNSSSDLRVTARHAATALGNANALDLYGIPDDSSQKRQDTYLGVTAQNQTSERWHNLVRLAFSQMNSQFVNPFPTGTPFDPFGFGANYLGDTVTIAGANGFSVTGNAILDFGGVYPQPFDAGAARRSVYAQTDFDFLSNLTGSFGFRYEHQNGFTAFPGSLTPATRDNYNYFLQAHGSLWNRLYATAGVGLEDNSVFGFEATPRLSLAYYLRRPSSSDFFGETKLKFNFGKGIKEPSIFNENSSLFALLSEIPSGPGLISQFGVSPVGPERSRSFDFGVEQGLREGRARLGITFFHNLYTDLIQFLDQGSLISIGVPTSVALATPFGATVNAQSSRTLGAETVFEADLGYGWHFQGQYTFLGAVVTRSFASSAFNPAFPNIPIGSFAPLEGSRPFRRPPHSGSLLLSYSRGKFGAALSGYFVSRGDDSTFLSDPFFGNSMLLPNRNLNSGYQKIDLSGRYSVHPAVTLFTSMENLLSQHYTPVFGFPAAPFTIRGGIKVTIGGETWGRN
jgi:iron complex outermembrane receptor protein/vitamin B12 transporter